MSVFGQLASLMIHPEKDAGFEDTFASRFGAAPLEPAEAAALRQRQFVNRRQGEGAPRAERVMGGLADLTKSLGEPVTRITDYSRSRVGTQAPLTEEDVFRQDLASRNIGKGIAQAGAYGLPLKNPLAAVPAQAELRGGALYANTPKTTPTVVQGIRAYHGSPHDFDKFDLSKIGTGEGAQAYGHGLYFAENEGVARAYKKNLAPAAADIAPAWNGRGWQVTTRDGANHGREFFPTKAEAEAFAAKYDKGRMYEVSLNARPEQFLDWDRPLSQQPSQVKAMVPVTEPIKVLQKYLGESGQEMAGADLYRSLGRMDGRARAAETLREAGIPGIRYLDQGSRTGGQGTSNYVVFDPGIIDILRKYGLAGATAAPLGALAAQDNYAAP